MFCLPFRLSSFILSVYFLSVQWKFIALKTKTVIGRVILGHMFQRLNCNG